MYVEEMSVCGMDVLMGYLDRPGRACLDGTEPFAEGQELAETAKRGARHDGAHEWDRIVRTRLHTHAVNNTDKKVEEVGGYESERVAKVVI